MSEANLITGGACVLCGLAFVGSVIPGVNDFLDTWVWRIGGVAILGFAVWFGVGELRDWLFYREAAKPMVQPLKPKSVVPDDVDEPDLVDRDALDDEAVG